MGAWQVEARRARPGQAGQARPGGPGLARWAKPGQAGGQARQAARVCLPAAASAQHSRQALWPRLALALPLLALGSLAGAAAHSARGRGGQGLTMLLDAEDKSHTRPGLHTHTRATSSERRSAGVALLPYTHQYTLYLFTKSL